MIPIGRPASLGMSATSAVSTSVMTMPISDRADDGEDGDRRVLAPDEGHGAFVDRPGDVLHRLRSLVRRQHVPGEVEREEDGDESRGQDDQLERLGIHQGPGLLLSRAVPGRDARSARLGGSPGKMLASGVPAATGAKPFRPRASVSSGRDAGQTRRGDRGYAVGSRVTRARGRLGQPARIGAVRRQLAQVAAVEIAQPDPGRRRLVGGLDPA